MLLAVVVQGWVTWLHCDEAEAVITHFTASGSIQNRMLSVARSRPARGMELVTPRLISYGSPGRGHPRVASAPRFMQSCSRRAGSQDVRTKLLASAIIPAMPGAATVTVLSHHQCLRLPRR